MTVKIAFIGAGRVTEHHCRMIEDVPEVRVVAVCDLNPERAAAVAAMTAAPTYANYHQMFAAHPDIDVAVIATPSGMHHEHVIEVIGQYGKHVLVEKPPFMNPHQMREAEALAKAKGVRIFPVLQNRYNTAVARVRDAVAAGELGDIRMASVRLRWCRPQRYYDRDPWRGTWSHDGGAMTNQGIHYLDLLRHLGGEIKRVNTTMATLGVNIEVEDTAAATFEFVKGGIGVVEITTAARPIDVEASISLIGSEGMAVLSGIATNELVVFTPKPEDCQAYSVAIPHGYGFGHRDTYRDVARDLRGEAPYPITLDDARSTVVLLNSLYASAERGGWLDVAEDNAVSRLGRSNEAVSNLYRTPAL